METVSMSYEELDRVRVIERVIEKRLTQAEAARILGLTSRQSQPQPRRRRGQAPLARDQPEVQEVVVVEPFHARALCRKNLRINPSFSAFSRARQRLHKSAWKRSALPPCGAASSRS